MLVTPLVKEDDNKSITIDFNNYVGNPGNTPVDLNSNTKKRGRPPKQKTEATERVMEVAIPANTGNDMLSTNTPYIQSYGETNNLLRGGIMEIDQLNQVVTTQLNSVVDSKTLRKKYDYVSELSSTSANLIGTKIRAIAEMNKTISDAHKLDMQRIKDLRISKADDETNSDKRIMDMFSAFVNTPVGSYGVMGPQFPSMQEMTMPNPGLASIDINNSIDPGFDAWKANMSPEQNRMVLEKTNPNVQTVVVYDQTTNNKYFDVIDRNTGQSVPNVPRPDPFLLADTYPNINNGTARNSNIDAVYPLVLAGAPSSLQDY